MCLLHVQLYNKLGHIFKKKGGDKKMCVSRNTDPVDRPTSTYLFIYLTHLLSTFITDSL